MKKSAFLLPAIGIILFSILIGCKKTTTPSPTTPPTNTGGGVTGGSTDGSTTNKLTLLVGTNGKDALVNSYSPTSNFGSYAYIASMAWTNSGSPMTHRILLDFDLTSIPAGATITKAKLKLYADTTTVYYGSAGLMPGHSTLTGANDATLRRVTSTWSESAVTWNNSPSVDDINKVTIPASTIRSQAYEIDVLALVKDEHLNPTLYNGFMITLNDETYYRSLIFYSGESSYTTLQPKLEIEY